MGAIRDTAIRKARAHGCGHTFVLIRQNAYPINLLKAIRNVPEVGSTSCAMANPVQILAAQNVQARGALGVTDRSSPKRHEGKEDIAWRHDLLRMIDYKR